MAQRKTLTYLIPPFVLGTGTTETIEPPERWASMELEVLAGPGTLTWAYREGDAASGAQIPPGRPYDINNEDGTHAQSVGIAATGGNVTLQGKVEVIVGHALPGITDVVDGPAWSTAGPIVPGVHA